MLITGCVMDFNLDLLLEDLLHALENIEYGRLVDLREVVMEVVGDETRLTDSGITNDDELERLRTILVSGPTL